MKYLFGIFYFFLFFSAHAQEIKHLDFIIVIDEQIVRESLGIKFVIKDETDYQEIETTEGYRPGNISLKQIDYDKLTSNQTKTLYIKFNYQTYVGNESYYYNYEIEYNKIWLQDGYNILRIYNLDKRKYKKKFDPISVGKNYTFEVESPSHTFLRIRKK